MNQWSASARSAFVDIALLIAFVAASYGLRLGELSIRGEESRWATVALEMRRGGDWIVPRQQGEPFLSRPPLGSWLIAAAAELRGECDAWAVRLPSLLAVLGTSLLIYGHGRTFLGRAGALGAAAGFASMPEVLQMGRLAESDIVFTFFLGGSLIVWHWGFTRGWPKALTWGLAYFLAGCGTLTKGPQAPAYFAATVGLYLLSTGQWRRLFSPAHLSGLAVYALVVGAWLVPFAAEMGFERTWRIVMGDSTDRFVNLSAWAVVRHLLVYPLEVVGCTAPWSYLLIAFASRRLRQSLADAGPHARFFALSLLVSFPTCWVTPGGQTRYLMPLYPCVALLAGIVIDRLAAPAPWLRFALTGLRNLTALVMLGSAVVVMALTWLVSNPALAHWKQPPLVAAAFPVGTLLAAALSWRSGPFALNGPRVTGMLALAAFLGAAYSGPVVNQLGSMSEHAAKRIELLQALIPGDATLASLGPVHHKFAYHFGRPIELLPENGVAPAGQWFCYVSWHGKWRSFDFACEEVAAISMDRHHSAYPEAQVIVLRRTLSAANPLAQRQP